MVFPSLPLYADPPNWNQHQAHHHLSSGGVVAIDSGGSGRNEAGSRIASFRPGSTAERARLAKIPPTEHALKCPRCDSTNTKFCYFNNYSLSQPRHFCKSCRRYWTRGGALRNVPVGGGCRRNRRAKSGGGSSSAKSAGNHRSGTGASSSAAVGGAMTSSTSLPLPPPAAAAAATPHPIPDYRNIGMQIQQFPMMLGGMEPLLPPPLQAPLLAPLPSLLYSSFAEGIEDVQDRSKEPVKVEENAQEQLGLPRLYLGDSSKSNDMFWGGGAAMASSGGSSSSGWATGYFSSFNCSSSADNNFL